MKKIRLLWPILFTLLLIVISIILLLVFVPIKCGFHTKYEYFAFIGTIIGGVFGPLSTLIGFIYLVYSFSDSDKQRKVDRMLAIVDKYVENINTILEKEIYLRIDDNKDTLQTSIKRCLILQNDNNKELVFSYDEKSKSLISLVSDSILIRRNLYYISSYLEKVDKSKIDIEEINYYKLHFSDLVYSLNNMDLFLTQKYIEHRSTSNYSREMEEMDKINSDFYRETHNS